MQSIGLNIPKRLADFFFLQLTHQTILRYDWSSLFQSTPPLPLTQLFRESLSSCGEDLTFDDLCDSHQQQLGYGKPAWSGLLTGQLWQHHYTYCLMTSSEEDRCLQNMVTMIEFIWILLVGARELLLLGHSFDNPLS